jgi:carboxypeptidase Taq
VHPFTTEFDLYDVRVTTRINPEELFTGLMGSVHEGGHALYEQGFKPSDQRTLLAAAPSLGIHESQSLLWENIVARTRPFWQHYLPTLRKAFPGRLDGVTVDQVYEAVNRVEPGFIRVDADEVTYNLHIVLRFEIERALIEGDLAVADVPEAWNAKVYSYLGLDVPSDAVGCLQDIHWSHGSIGYFPSYALGNIYAAQLYEKIRHDIPNLHDQFGSGHFEPLLGWLRVHVHRYGRRRMAADIVSEASGQEAPDPGAYIRYLNEKYGELYRL